MREHWPAPTPSASCNRAATELQQKLRTCVSVDAGALAGADAFCEDNMQALIHPVFLARLMLEHYRRLSPAAARARMSVSSIEV
jgi:hypothetical protein